MPISHTAAVCSGRVASTVSGRPMWLFRLPLVNETLNCSASTAAVKSLALVLPFEPVMQTTGMSSWRRHQCANCCSASNVSETVITAVPGGGSPPSQRLTTTMEAPFSKACGAKVLASNFSPASAKNAQPDGSERVSVETPPSARAEASPTGAGASRSSASLAAVIMGAVSAVSGWRVRRRCRRSGLARPWRRACGRRSRCARRQIADRSRGPCRRSG